ncbi:hypothetical protein PM116P4_00025 [Parabacteroides phage PM116P4]|nr:hypothetical protein PM116P4_00025 [Parabacteroides phage PM116P4]WAX17518.1 hypothetical protein PM116P5_00002 [Parabacteroides phage PM116P5]
MRKNRRLGAMRTIVVKFCNSNVQMYSVTEERYNEILTYRYQAQFMRWNLRTDVSYSFGRVFKMSDGLWYRESERDKLVVEDLKSGEAVYINVGGLNYEVPRSRYLSRTVEGEMQNIAILEGGVEKNVRVSVKWLSNMFRAFMRYAPSDMEENTMCMPSIVKTSKTAAKRGKGFIVDKVFNLRDMISLYDPYNEFSR